MNIDAIEQLVRSEHDIWKNVEEKERLHHFRLTFEPYIFNLLLLRYGQKLDEFWKTYHPKKSEKAFVIVERRCHPNFWFVLRNIAWANPDMSVYIFCSDVNIGFLKSLIGDKDIHLIPVFKGSPGREEAIKEYNAFLTSCKMYEAIDAEWIIVVQMDVFIRRKISDEIFVGEYWGYPFGWRPEYAGGGGASVRNVKKCYELCLDSHSNMAEDVWFCEKMLTGEVPSFDFRREFIMENVLSRNPYIVHQFWTYIDSIIHIDFKKYWDYILTFEFL